MTEVWHRRSLIASKLVNSREREEQKVAAAGIRRLLHSTVAKQGQGLSPGVQVSGIGLVLCNEECAGWGWSVTGCFPIQTSHR